MHRGTSSATTTPPATATRAGRTTHEPRATRRARLVDEGGLVGGPGRVARELGAGALGLVAAATALTFLVTVARPGAAGSGGVSRPEDALLALLAWVGVLLAAWLA